MGRAELHPVPPGEEDQEVPQLGVAVRDRRPRLDRTVHQLQHDLVVRGDDDVLHPVVVQQILEPAHPEQPVEHGPGQHLLLRRRPRHLAHRQPVRRRLPHQPGDDPLAAVLHLGGILGTVTAVDLGDVTELLGRPRPQHPDQTPVHTAGTPTHGTPTLG